MANYLPDSFTTSTKSSLIEEGRLADASLQAESLVNTMAFLMVLKSALELGVIDTIASVEEGVWLSSSEIAFRLPTKPTNPEAPVLLERMLVLLASHSLLKYRMAGAGENGRTGKWRGAHLKDVILKGEDAFTSAHGMKIFEYTASNEPFAELFNRAMSEYSTLTMKKVLEVYRGFEDVNTF
ncbi:hypothetical protein Bca52824_083725 [Brassica carinata]|uniref:Plant methyltransferase dimerisation domain-containing protein n=1 Tax=Brassica carinata TaxID=52824 RepID=A0A8X7TTW9_BRACI|nr:hypothetical protein Bca52824_083725 [Brassica carinata]